MNRVIDKDRKVWNIRINRKKLKLKLNWKGRKVGEAQPTKKKNGVGWGVDAYKLNNNNNK